MGQTYEKYEKYLTKLKQNLIKFALVENPHKTIGKGTCYTDSLQEKMNTFIKKNSKATGEEGRNRKVELSKNSANAVCNFRTTHLRKYELHSLLQSITQNKISNLF